MCKLSDKIKEGFLDAKLELEEITADENPGGWDENASNPVAQYDGSQRKCDPIGSATLMSIASTCAYRRLL